MLKDGGRCKQGEVNGDKTEGWARGGCREGCDFDWPENIAICIAADTYLKVIKAKLKAQAA